MSPLYRPNAATQSGGHQGREQSTKFVPLPSGLSQLPSAHLPRATRRPVGAHSSGGAYQRSALTRRRVRAHAREVRSQAREAPQRGAATLRVSTSSTPTPANAAQRGTGRPQQPRRCRAAPSRRAPRLSCRRVRSRSSERCALRVTPVTPGTMPKSRAGSSKSKSGKRGRNQYTAEQAALGSGDYTGGVSLAGRPGTKRQVHGAAPPHATARRALGAAAGHEHTCTHMHAHTRAYAHTHGKSCSRQRPCATTRADSVCIRALAHAPPPLCFSVPAPGLGADSRPRPRPPS